MTSTPKPFHAARYCFAAAAVTAGAFILASEYSRKHHSDEATYWQEKEIRGTGAGLSR